MTENLSIAQDAALIVIDVQQGFDDGYWGRRDNPHAEENMGRLIDRWAATGRPVVIVRHDSVDDRSPLHPSATGNALKPIVAEVEPALMVTKTVNSAFYGSPDLDAWLRSAGIRQVVLAGIQTNMCCETTARMAGNLGYDVVFAIDAMHTFDLAGPDGTVLTAQELTRATATSLHGGGFARVLSTDAVLDAETRR